MRGCTRDTRSSTLPSTLIRISTRSKEPTPFLKSRQNAADSTKLPYFDDGQQTHELRFEFVLGQALETFPTFGEKQWFLDEV